MDFLSDTKENNELDAAFGSSPSSILSVDDNKFSTTTSSILNDEDSRLDTESSPPVDVFDDSAESNAFDNAFENNKGMSEYEIVTPITPEAAQPAETDDDEIEEVPQNDLLNYYREINPELFNDEGTLIDVEGAIELGIGVVPPAGPVVPTGEKRVFPDDNAGGLILQLPSKADEIVADRLEKEISARRSFSEDTAARDAAAEADLLQSEEFQDAYSTMTDDEFNAIARVNQLLSGEIPTKNEIALRTARKERRSNVVAAMEERASAYVLLERANDPLYKDDINQADIDAAREVIGNDTSDKNISKFVSLTGPAGLSLLEGLGSLVNTVGDKYRDVTLNILETTRDAIPEAFDEVFTDSSGKVLTPKEIADDFGSMSMGALESLDALIAMASQGRMSSGAVNPLAKLPVKLNNAVKKAENDLLKAKTKLKNIPTENKTARQKQRAEVKKITAVLAERKKRLSAAVNKQIDDMRAEDIARFLKDSERWNQRLNITRARFNTKKKKEEIAAENKRIADENKEVTHDLIVAFEQRTNTDVSDVNPSTKLKTINPDKAREAGRETSVKIMEAQQPTKGQSILGTADVIESPLARLQTGADEVLTSPVIQPEKIKGLTAAVVRLKQAHPDAFKPKKFKDGRDYNLIDHLFELTVNGKLNILEGDELFTLLNKSGISFEDYILTVVHGGSQAGKILNQLSQLKRLRPRNELEAIRQASIDEVQHGIRQAWMRIEGARRGGLVSQIATAARNAESALVRAPMEGLGNIIDNVLYQSMLAADGKAPVVAEMAGIYAGGKSLLTFSNSSSSAWQGSMRHLAYIFGSPQRIKEFNDFIFESPKLTKQFELLFKQMNELQQASGRGDAKTTAKLKQLAIDITTNPKEVTLHKSFDATMSVVEDGVYAINVFNRLQEFIIRRGVLFGEMDRLMKREWNIDFIGEIGNGNFASLMNDAAPFRPPKARTFMEIFEEATTRALDTTYSKQPDIPIFKDIASLLVRSGGTLALPFPRFMFNGIELVGQYSLGATLPAYKKLTNIATFGKAYKGGQLGFKDRQRISRNIVGVGAILGMAKGYEYLTTTGQQPADYTQIPLGDGSDTVLDIKPQHPLRPIAFLAKALEQHREGTLLEWIGDGKDAFETFVGTAYSRTGMAAGIINDIRNFFLSDKDLNRAERSGKAVGGIIAQYLNSWMTFFNQFVELERAGISLRGEEYANRPLEYTDVRNDPLLDYDYSYQSARNKSSLASGRGTTAAEEAAYPDREFLFQDQKVRKHPLARVFAGLTMTSRDSPEGEFFKRLGLDDRKLGSRSEIPSIYRYETKYLREKIVPQVFEIAQKNERTLLRQWSRSSSLQAEYKTARSYAVTNLRAQVLAAFEQARKDLKNVTMGIGGAELRSPDANKLLFTMRMYRSLPSQDREAAHSQFIKDKNRVPDPSDPMDLFRLYEYGKQPSKAMKDAIKLKN